MARIQQLDGGSLLLGIGSFVSSKQPAPIFVCREASVWYHRNSPQYAGYLNNR